MLSNTRFFFTRNTSVLNTFKQSSLLTKRGIFNVNAPRIVLSPPNKVTSYFSSFKRGYSTARATASTVAATVNTVTRGIPVKSPLSHPSVGWWLIGTSGLVFGIVVLGGLTRLTESGLSITEWKPVTGAIPPLTQEEWEIEFNKYKDSPEFKQLNSHITLEEFKFIFSMEWGHRLVGRTIGMLFILPALYFWKSGKLASAHVKWRVIGLTGLLGLQGAIGWWMVKSGLDESELAERNSKPTVSQYRLTTHLGAAFLMYLGVLWTGFEILNENRWSKIANSETLTAIFGKLNNPKLQKVRSFGTGLLALTFITAMTGGMVAGLDAGLIYNTFPHMGDDWLPSNNELMSPVFARLADQSDLWWRNLLENPTTVQLVHRIFATSTFFAVLALHMYAVKHKAIIPKPAQKMIHTVMGLASLQVALGISTLIYLVPIPLAAAHQAGALALLTGVLAFCARLKKPRPEAVAYINRLMKEKLIK